MAKNPALQTLVGTALLIDLGDVAKLQPIQEKQSRGVNQPLPIHW